MIVKVLQNKEGKYLKDYGLETVDELFHPVTGLMCYWVTKDFTKNSVTLGFKAVDRCYFCGKPAVTIDKNGHYVCEKCNSIYTGDVE